MLTACAFFFRDMLTLRFRLAFLNSQAAISVAPKVCDLMSVQLGWDEKEKKKQMEDCMTMLHEFGGPIPNKDGAQLSSTTVVDIRSMFKALDVDKNGYIDFIEFQEGAKSLGFPFQNEQQAKDAFALVDSIGDGRVDEKDFIEWWTVEGMLLFVVVVVVFLFGLGVLVVYLFVVVCLLFVVVVVVVVVCCCSNAHTSFFLSLSLSSLSLFLFYTQYTGPQDDELRKQLHDTFKLDTDKLKDARGIMFG